MTEDVVSMIRRLVESGKSVRQAGKELGIDRTTVWKICRRSGIELSRRRKDELTLAVVHFADQGMSHAEIGRELGLSKSGIRWRCLRYGIITERVERARKRRVMLA